jgi:DNA-binding XRE family transcriptional regulator
MPIIGRQCSRDGKTVCPRMSEARLPVNQDGPGLTLVFGWSSEERRAEGVPAALQGIDFSTDSSKLLPLDFCPWCGAKIASSATSVRTHVAARESSEGPVKRVRPAVGSGAAIEVVAATAPAPVPAPTEVRSTTLKVLRERLGLSQAELGEKLGLARSSVANYENGRSPLSQRLIKWMAKHEAKLTDRADGPAARSGVAA